MSKKCQPSMENSIPFEPINLTFTFGLKLRVKNVGLIFVSGITILSIPLDEAKRSI